MRSVHAAFGAMMATEVAESADTARGRDQRFTESTTSLSLARVLAAGCLARLDATQASVSIWDPSVGTGYAAHLLTTALISTGVRVEFRGQDINSEALAACERRLQDVPDAQLGLGDTLTRDVFEDFRADLVIVDAPCGMDWRQAAPRVEIRQRAGEFHFGLPQQSDSTWLFISLALEKLRSPEDGGGRVVALVAPRSLSSGGATANVRRKVVEAGLLESVVRLPEALAPNTSLPLYLVTLSNRPREAGRGKTMIGDFQTQFTTERGRRKIPDSAIEKLESSLRTGKPGPRNRTISSQDFIRHQAEVARSTRQGEQLKWSITTYRNAPIDDHLLETRYGPDSGISLAGAISEVYDLNPGHILRDDSKTVTKELAAKNWPAVRLSTVLESTPSTIAGDGSNGVVAGTLCVPTTRAGTVSTHAPDPSLSGRVLGVEVDPTRIDPNFLAAWLNSEQGTASRLRALDASSTGSAVRALRSESKALLRWADELIVPIPPLPVQERLVAADARLASFQDELGAQREGIWADPAGAEACVSRFAKVFDDSITGWLSELPFPVASALWTAETSRTPGDRLEAYFHAWEALVAFHASALLSACRSDPGGSAVVERSIRETLDQQGIGIDRASFGTWNVIIEQTSKSLRNALTGADLDEIARVRATFSELGDPTIERLISTEATAKFKAVGGKRNRWRGHGGHVSEEQREARIGELVADLHDLRRIVGDAWAQLPLVRAGSCKKVRTGFVQEVELAMGERSPFLTREIRVAEAMQDGELYLVRDQSQSPLRLVNFVQLRGAPSEAQYTSYFYNRTEGSRVRMVSYQYGPESETACDALEFREDFGALLPD